jgi:hypothetical protein
MIRDGLARTSIAPKPFVHPSAAADVRVPAGRRISILAWSAAGVAGVAMWVLIFKLV